MEAFDASRVRRVGALIPCTNVMCEMEFNRVLPRHYQLHVGRLQMGPINEAGFRMQDADVDYQARLLSSARVEYVFLAQTNASYFVPGYDAAVIARIGTACKVPAGTGGQLTGRAAVFLGAKRVAFISPYSDELNELGRRYYVAEHGLDIVRIESYGEAATSDLVNDMKPEVGLAAIHRANSPEVEAFILAGALPTLHLMDTWERQLGKPVISTIQACMWGALQALGGETLAGCGRLLAKRKT
ncbi:MAG: hypothetical protein EXR27_18390 [Betaproteobacteria bacterium]|nr:hypothetical protein [Betaproteobacteria bacterium]